MLFWCFLPRTVFLELTLFPLLAHGGLGAVQLFGDLDVAHFGDHPGEFNVAGPGDRRLMTLPPLSEPGDMIVGRGEGEDGKIDGRADGGGL